MRALLRSRTEEHLIQVTRHTSGDIQATPGQVLRIIGPVPDSMDGEVNTMQARLEVH